MKTSIKKSASTSTSGKYDEQSVGELWRQIVDYVSKQSLGRSKATLASELDEWIRSDLHLRRRADTLFDQQIGLGVQLRWNIAMDLLFKRHWEAEYESIKAGGMPREFLQLGTLESKEDAREDRLARYANDREYIDVLCAALSRMNADGYTRNLRRNYIDHRDFLVPIHGPRAVFAFRKFLSRGISPISSSGELVPEYPLTLWAQREEVLERVYGHLGLHDGREAANRTDAESMPASWRPIINVQMEGSPFDQCALAHKIMAKLESIQHQERPILLLPCSRLVPDHDFRGLDYLVYNIHAFLHQRPLSWTPPCYSPQDIPEKILEIRSALAKQPAIIVFVGYQPTRGASSNLRRLILDEPLVPLLSQILHPLVGVPGQPTEVRNLFATKFVVLSEGPMDVLEAYIDQEIEFPPPVMSQHYVDMLRVRAPDYEAATGLHESLDRMPVHPSEAVVMGYLQLRRTEDVSGYEFHRPLAELAKFDNADVLDQLVSTIAQQSESLDFFFLKVIACARTGMRRDTLVRCARMWDKATGGPSQADKERRLPDRDDVSIVAEEWFDEFLVRFSYILAQGIDEQVPEVYPGTHPYEYPEGADPLRGKPLHLIDGPREETSIDFRYGQIRDAVSRYMDIHSEKWERLLIHQILCSEALRQQLIVTRHAPAARKLALRSYRRLLEGVYHGFHSLPHIDDLALSRSWPHLPEGTFLPVDPVERFRFLYCTLIMGTLEDGSAYRLSRDWAADALKADLLVLAHNAFGDAGESDIASLAKVPVWHGDERISHQFPDLGKSHFDAMAVAANMLDDHEMWAAIEAGAQRCDIRPSWLDFGVLERAQIDLLAARLGPMGQAQKLCLKALESLGVSIDLFERAPWNETKDEKPAPVDPLGLEQFLDGVVLKIVHECTTQTDQQIAIDDDRLRAISACLVRLGELHYQAIEYGKGFAVWRSSMTAFAMLSTAWRLQERRSTMALEGAVYSLSPRGFRVLARALLECIRYLQIPKHRDLNLPRGLELTHLLARHARKALDEYTLRFSLYAPDVVSMLVLESRYARTVGAMNSDDVFSKHRVALEFLQRAEKRMADFEPRPRLQIRLLIERCATLRGLAAARRIAAGVHDQSGRLYLGLALLDVQQLDNLILSIFGRGIERDQKRMGEFWRKIVQRQRDLTLQEVQRYKHGQVIAVHERP
jgi:hypothetical protein